MPGDKPTPPSSGSSPPTSTTPCPHEGTKTTGNRIDIVFDPSKSKQVTKCDRIVHVQFIRLTADGVVTKPGDCWSGWKYRDPVMTSDGWWVDHLETETTPDYQQGSGDGKKNGGSTNAVIMDAPDILNFVPGKFYVPTTNKAGTKEFRMEFFTYAWCMKGPDCGTWYEGVHWEYVKTWENHRDGSAGTSKILDKNITTDPSPSEIDAFDKFNKAKGFVPCT